jgi:3',5'-nucleoside bisphosphate phosphatase
MRLFRGDLHIHTLLSPCGDLDMSPANIIAEASIKGLDLIGITDHNTTLHCDLAKRLAVSKGIYVMQGAEVTTKEEVHCLAFFENTEALNEFQEFLDENLPDIPNNPSIFGHQVQIDENENIIFEEERLLVNAISKTFREVETFVHGLGGIFIPAHIDRKKNSIYSQLGFLPEDMKADALEVSLASSPVTFTSVHPEISKFTLIRSSDSHYPAQIGTLFTDYFLEEVSFPEIRMALNGVNGRKVILR